MFSYFKKWFNRPVIVERQKPIYKYVCPENLSFDKNPEPTKDEQIDEAVFQKLLKILKRYPPHEWIPWKESACDNGTRIFSHNICGIRLNHYNFKSLWLDGVNPRTSKGWNRAIELRSKFLSIRENHEKEKRQKVEEQLINKFLKVE